MQCAIVSRVQSLMPGVGGLPGPYWGGCDFSFLMVALVTQLLSLRALICEYVPLASRVKRENKWKNNEHKTRCMLVLGEGRLDDGMKEKC